MWVIFILPMALVGAVGAIFGLVNGGAIITLSLVADQWHRQRGHRIGEGIFTDREGGFVFGLRVAKDSTDLGQFLATMADLFPDSLGRFKNHSYDLTESEGVFLRSMVRVSQGILAEFLTIVDIEDEIEILAKKDQIEGSLTPIILFLDNIPAPRAKGVV